MVMEDLDLSLSSTFRLLAKSLSFIFLTCEMRVEKGESLKTFSTQKCLESCALLPEAVFLPGMHEFLVKLISLGGQC